MEWPETNLRNFVVGSVIGLAILLLYHHGIFFYTYWKKRGVPYVKPKYPFFGNLFETCFSLRPINEIQLEEYASFPGERFYGTFYFSAPALVIKDPELIESILVRDFQYFSQRSNDHDQNSSCLSSHLFNLKGEEWEFLRGKLTPSFSSAGLKGMHDHVVKCADILVGNMYRYVRKKSFELKESTASYATDIILSCAFGIDANPLKDEYWRYKQIRQTENKFRFILRTHWPRLNRILVWPGLPRWLKYTLDDMLEETVTETLKLREENNITRHDFLHLMNQVYKEDREMIEKGLIERRNGMVFTMHHIVSNAYVFFLAGSDSTASTLSSILYELALNPDVQAKLYREICEYKQKYRGLINYQAIQKMKYLRQVFEETLRLRAHNVTLERVVTKQYRIPGTDVVLPVGMRVTVPVFALHHDPEHFPDPNLFVPERFNIVANEMAYKKGTYLPFGDGPRNCIATRFAKYVVKFAVCEMLSYFVLKKCPRTENNVRFDRRTNVLTQDGGLWIKLERRSN